MFRKLFKGKKQIRVNEEILAILDVLIADVEHANRMIEKTN